MYSIVIQSVSLNFDQMVIGSSHCFTLLILKHFIFTEVLTHGSMVNVSGRPHRTLYYMVICQTGGQGLVFSQDVMEGLTATQPEIIHLK